MRVEQFRELYEQGVIESGYGYHYEYTWDDYAIIISSVLLLPAYLFSIRGKRSLVSNKYARAVLMHLPALFMIGVQLRLVDLTILTYDRIIVIALHAHLIPLINKHADNSSGYDPIQRYEYYWGDYAIIIASVVLFPAYLYSIWGKKPLVSNKYARASLMLLPALFLIGVQLRQVDLALKFAKFIKERRGLEFEPFSCASSNGHVDADCALSQSYIFVPIVTGFFTIIEVAVTLFRGPLHPAKETYH
ncbi:hypothetical protein BGX30_011782 [Mortierella sp. GBA39]|nr:hypothetical protein BGX30_011782 [Mortierella sp. GBA39]